MFLQVGIAESAMNGGGNPNVRKIEIVITPTDNICIHLECPNTPYNEKQTTEIQ
jgi:hypothetical protein